MDLPPHVIGRFFLMQQYLAGKSSFWYPYIATLPQPDAISSWSLPPFWPEDDFAFLEGTNTGIAAQVIQDQLKGEFKEARKVLKAANFSDWQDYTRPLYHWAFAMFSSRSFRPSLVIPPAVQDAVLAPSAAAAVAIDDFSILLPVFDIINHNPKADVRWLVDDDVSAAAVCRFQTLDPYQPGEQVFNSYGKKTNSELLLSYGFILPETDAMHNDYVHVRKKAAAADQDTSSSAAQQPQDFLVSLRPMRDTSSLAGRARQKAAVEKEQVRPEFSHVEDSLVWDLSLMVVGDGNKVAFMERILNAEIGPDGPTPTQELECLGRIVSISSSSSSSSLPEQVLQVVEQVKQVLLAKLGMEYDKLCSTDPGVAVDEEGDEVLVEVVPQNKNQQLAMQYREQVKKVLENAISSLAPDWQNEGDEEQG